MPKLLKTKTNKSHKNYKPWTNYMFSAIKSMILTTLCFIGISFVLMNNASFTAFYKLLAYIVIGIGAILSGYLSYRHIKGRGFLNGFIGGLVYCFMIIVLLMGVMRFQISYNILYVVLISIAGGLIGGISGANL